MSTTNVDKKTSGNDESIDRRKILETMAGGSVIAVAGCLGGDDGGSGDGSGTDDSSGDDSSDRQTVQFLTMGVGDNIEDSSKRTTHSSRRNTMSTSNSPVSLGTTLSRR